MLSVREKIERINIEGFIGFMEPMSEHTTFRTGGPAEVFARPANRFDLQALLECCSEEGVRPFVLGGGANILVSDRGIPGLVIDMGGLDGISVSGTEITAEAGLPVTRVSEAAAAHALSGFEFIFSMPGSFGGAVFMNARCYGSEMADVLTRIEFYDETAALHRLDSFCDDFSYKDTPFMKNPWTIVSATISLTPGDRTDIRATMTEYENDRRSKGHFSAPCAGSVFKNNRAFGSPSGKIIDELGLRGLTIGGAQISPRHANIIINTGSASSTDIRLLIEDIKHRVEHSTGYLLEPEIRFIGDWDDWHSSEHSHASDR